MFSPSSSQWLAITVGIPLWLSTSSGQRCSSWSASHTRAWGGSSTTLYRPAPACTSCPAPWRGWPPLPSVPAQQHCSTSSAWTWSYTPECCTGCLLSTVVPNRVVKDEKGNTPPLSALFNNCATYPLPSPHASPPQYPRCARLGSLHCGQDGVEPVQYPVSWGGRERYSVEL